MKTNLLPKLLIIIMVAMAIDENIRTQVGINTVTPKHDPFWTLKVQTKV